MKNKKSVNPEKKTKKLKLKWSVKTSFWGAVSIALLVSLVVLIALKKSIWIELEIIVGIVSFFIFIFLYYVLYHGVRFDENERFTITRKKISFESITNLTQNFNTGGSIASTGAEAGVFGLLIGFVLDIIISLVLMFLIAILFWVGFNIIMTAIAVLFPPLFFIFNRSLRFIVAKGRRCYKDGKMSFIFALKTTAVNAIWLYMIILSGHYVFKYMVK